VTAASRDLVTAASRDLVTEAEMDAHHVTRTVIDANQVTGARGHVTAAVVDSHAGQVQADDDSWIPFTYREFLDIFHVRRWGT
jgi:hypothetical protein